MSTANHDTYESKGQREDLANVIWDTSPTDTPFQSMIASRGKSSAVIHSWQRNQLAAAAANAQIEGGDPSGNNAAATERLSNYNQIAWTVVRLSDTLEAVDKAGRAKEMAFQLLNRGLELKNDVEYTITGTNHAAALGSEAAARYTATLEAWIQTNPTAANGSIAASTAAVGTMSNGFVNGAATDGTPRALTETFFKAAIQSCWDSGGKPTYVLCGGKQKVTISTFTGGGTKFDKMEDKTVYQAVDIYESDFGRLTILPSRFIRKTSTVDRNIFILDKRMWSVDYLRAYSKKVLATSGDNEQQMIRCEFALTAREERSSTKVSDLS